MSSKKRRVRLTTVLLAVVAAYAVWLGRQVVAYKRYPSAPASAEASSSPPPPKQREIRGAYHLHSTFSDGRKTVDEIAETASRAGLDFIILTDHGSPNRRSLAAQGWKHGLLVLAGTEISSSRGHLVALAFDLPRRRFSQNAELAALEVQALGGFTVIAHPYSKTRWSWGWTGAYGGIEVMDSDSVIKRNWRRALTRLPLMLVKPEVVLLKMISRPEDTLRQWDRMLASGTPRGYYSVDAHWLYGPAFKIFRIYALLDSSLAEDFAAARAQVLEALRGGRFFNAVDAAADPSGFRFWLDGKTLRVKTPYSFAHETRIIYHGRVAATSPADDLAYPASEPGPYRVEVYLRERSPLRATVPWIISNPVVVPAEGKEDR
jgi:hypothetical protein